MSRAARPEVLARGRIPGGFTFCSIVTSAPPILLIEALASCPARRFEYGGTGYQNADMRVHLEVP